MMTKDFEINLASASALFIWADTRTKDSSHERVTVQKIARLSWQVVGHLFCDPSLCSFWASHTPSPAWLVLWCMTNHAQINAPKRDIQTKTSRCRREERRGASDWRLSKLSPRSTTSTRPLHYLLTRISSSSSWAVWWNCMTFSFYYLQVTMKYKFRPKQNVAYSIA